MSNEIALRPSYWASVSGGKDSLYMLNLILHNLDHIIRTKWLKKLNEMEEAQCQEY